MAYDERLARRIRTAFEGRRDVTERKMFGGLAFLLKGRMCCGIVGLDLMVRVAECEIDAVMRGRHVRPMDFTGKPLSGFVYVSPGGYRTAEALRAWLARGERFVQQKAAGSARPTRGKSRERSRPVAVIAPDQSQRKRKREKQH